MGTKAKMFLGVMVLALVLMPLASITQADMKGHEGDAEMKMHHVHIVMNHGLGMVTEGSTMVMLGEMNMASGIDAMTVDHGKQMIKDGKGVVQRALSGDEMMGMHKEGQSPDKNPAMKDTHDLGEGILKYIGLVEGMKMGSMDKNMMMEMHHQHIMINHALEMAAEGSNLVMLGDMDMAGAVDDYTVEHGKMMIKNAKGLLGEVTGGKAMTDMHKMGTTPKDDPMMKSTHDLIERALKIIDLYEKM